MTKPKQMTPNKECSICKGSGVEYYQPYGNARLCTYCSATGKRLGLNELAEARRKLFNLRNYDTK